MHQVKIYALYRAKQPIIHTEETIGNISKIKKLRVIHNGKSVLIPALSGNSFRGQLRDILADRMFSVLTEGRKRRVSLPTDNYGVIYSGGVMNPNAKLGMDLMKRWQEIVPLLRLLGSAFGNVMLPSKLAITHIIPYAEETESILQSTKTGLPNQWQSQLPSPPPKRTDLIFNDGPLTRKDDTKDPTKQRYVRTDPAKEQKQQMIYYVECIPPGTCLLQEIYAKYPLDELELGCLFDGLQVYLTEPHLGGRSSAGYGQVAASYQVILDGQSSTLQSNPSIGLPQPIQNAAKRYEDYLKKRKLKILKELKGASGKGGNARKGTKKPKST